MQFRRYMYLRQSMMLNVVQAVLLERNDITLPVNSSHCLWWLKMHYSERLTNTVLQVNDDLIVSA